MRKSIKLPIENACAQSLLFWIVKYIIAIGTIVIVYLLYVDFIHCWSKYIIATRSLIPLLPWKLFLGPSMKLFSVPYTIRIIEIDVSSLFPKSQFIRIRQSVFYGLSELDVTRLTPILCIRLNWSLFGAGRIFRICTRENLVFLLRISQSYVARPSLQRPRAISDDLALAVPGWRS